MKIRNPFYTEKKGYTTPEDPNVYFQALAQYLGLAGRMIDFINYDRAAIRLAYTSSVTGSYILYGIVSRLAATISETMKYAKLYKGNEVVTKHPSINVLKNPNDLENTREFIEAWAINQLLFGESFVYCEKGVALSKGVRNMYVLPAEVVDIVTSKAFPIAGFKFGYASQEMTPENMIWTRKYNPDPATFHGLSPVAVASKLVQIMDAADKRQLNGLANGGGGRLVTPKPGENGMTTPLQRQNLQDEQNNIKNANKTKVIGTAVEVHELGDKPVDLQILGSSENATKALCFVYNLPYSLYESNTTFNNQKEAEKIMYRAAGIPYANMFLEKFNKIAVPEPGMEWMIDQDSIPALRDDTESTVRAYKLASRSYNELGAILGFDRTEEPWADQPIFPMSETPGVPYIPTADDFSEV